jgi:hypothetical protein
MIAGLAGVATPASVFAAECAGALDAAPVAVLVFKRGDKLIISGRVIDATCNPIAGAQVDLGEEGVSARTDADGRFMLVANARAGTRPTARRVRITHPAYAAHETHGSVAPTDGNIWRGTLEIALA